MTCGPTSLRFHLRGRARTIVRHGQGVKLKVRATFTPTGGTPHTQVETILLRRPPRGR